MDIIAKDPIYFLASVILIPYMTVGFFHYKRKYPTSIGLLFYVVGELIFSYFLIRGTINPVYGHHPFYHNYYGLWILGLTSITIGQRIFAIERKEDHGFWENNKTIIYAIIADIYLLVTYLYKGH